MQSVCSSWFAYVLLFHKNFTLYIGVYYPNNKDKKDKPTKLNAKENTFNEL